MPDMHFSVEHSQFDVRLDHVVPAVEQAIELALKPVAASMAAEAQAYGLGHIHLEGLKPGLYLASIYGGTFRSSGAVGGYVRSSSPLAHLLELGAVTPPHEIMPSAASVLASEATAQVFGRLVHSPGATMPPYPALAPAFEGAQDAIRAALESAAHSVAV